MPFAAEFFVTAGNWRINVRAEKRGPSKPQLRWFMFNFNLNQSRVSITGYFSAFCRETLLSTHEACPVFRITEALYASVLSLFLFHVERHGSSEHRLSSPACLGSEARMGQLHEHIMPCPSWPNVSLSTHEFAVILLNPSALQLSPPPRAFWYIFYNRAIEHLEQSLTVVFLNLFILFLAALGLRCCAWAFSSCGKRGLLYVAVRGLLIVVASLCFRAQALDVRASVVVAHGLSSCGLCALECRLSSCGAWA